VSWDDTRRRVSRRRARAATAGAAGGGRPGSAPSPRPRGASGGSAARPVHRSPIRSPLPGRQQDGCRHQSMQARRGVGHRRRGGTARAIGAQGTTARSRPLALRVFPGRAGIGHRRTRLPGPRKASAWRDGTSHRRAGHPGEIAAAGPAGRCDASKRAVWSRRVQRPEVETTSRRRRGDEEMSSTERCSCSGRLWRGSWT
jgi:hypothetical protein